MQNMLSNTLENKLHYQIIKVCHYLEMPLHFNRIGPRIFTNYQRIALIILYKRSKKSLVDFIKELYESKWSFWLGLKEIPGKSTLHDWIKLFEMPVIKALHKAVLVDEKPEIMAVDGTGIDSWQRSRHYEKKLMDSNMPYAKLDALIDVKTMLVHDHVLRIKPRHDTVAAAQMFKRSKHKNVKILGDKGYDSEPLHELVAKKGNKFFAPVRNSSRKTPKGYYRKKCVKKDEDYNKRLTVESMFHALKHRILPVLRCRLHYMKKKEMAWTIILYNMTKITEQIKIILKILIVHSG